MNRLRDFFAPDVGRLRRPEISGSEMAGMNVLSGASAKAISETLTASVERRKGLSDERALCPACAFSATCREARHSI